MSSRYDEVAKAVAKKVPRRKILKLLAGGAVAAATGSALSGSAGASRDPLTLLPPFDQMCQSELAPASIELNGSFMDELTEFNCEVVIPWWSNFYRQLGGLFGIEINGGGPI